MQKVNVILNVKRMMWKDYITIDPNIFHGKVCIKGTRVFVSIILDCLAEGMSDEEILENYPSLKKEHIKVALQYGAMLARQDILSLTENQG